MREVYAGQIGVGSNLYFVPSDGRYRHQATPVVVTKVDRLWLTLSNGHRVDRETLIADGAGFSSPGRCYLSAEAYEAERAADSAWSRLENALRYGRRNGVTLGAVQQAAALLNLDIGDKP